MPGFPTADTNADWQKLFFRNLELPTLAHQIVIARGKWPTGLAVELVNFFMVTWQHDAEQHRRDQSQTE
ncbi:MULTISPECIES: hypothetical protein [Rhodobacterales]|uniref:hypothetical protein n=1 Tax=Rhodobacterales TaxID=204455 RepID=UPI0012FB1705|nr:MULTISPECIES: hypothetical protein [Paracoccaceae]MDF2143255.1 hypothetical protein [Paenirhodobacter sp. CAU 1674]NHM18507.1 hypothetical protein [Tritonibacter mobilis]NHM22251.1 hypothetical protein [Tritonibacter mobilis]